MIATSPSFDVIADAIEEFRLRARSFDLRLGEDHDRFIRSDSRWQLARLVGARMHATGQQGQQ